MLAGCITALALTRLHAGGDGFTIGGPETRVFIRGPNDSVDGGQGHSLDLPCRFCQERQEHPMPSIVILKSGESSTHDLSRDETVIGRHPECTIQIDSNMVSRKHARIVRDGARFLVEDM